MQLVEFILRNGNGLDQRFFKDANGVLMCCQENGRGGWQPPTVVHEGYTAKMLAASDKAFADDTKPQLTASNCRMLMEKLS